MKDFYEWCKRKYYKNGEENQTDPPSPPPPNPISKPPIQHCKYKMQDFIRCIHFALQVCMDYVEEYCIALSNDEESILKQLNELFFEWTCQIMGEENQTDPPPPSPSLPAAFVLYEDTECFVVLIRNQQYLIPKGEN